MVRPRRKESHIYDRASCSRQHLRLFCSTNVQDLHFSFFVLNCQWPFQFLDKCFNSVALRQCPMSIREVLKQYMAFTGRMS